MEQKKTLYTRKKVLLLKIDNQEGTVKAAGLKPCNSHAEALGLVKEQGFYFPAYVDEVYEGNGGTGQQLAIDSEASRIAEFATAVSMGVSTLDSVPPEIRDQVKGYIDKEKNARRISGFATAVSRGDITLDDVAEDVRDLVKEKLDAGANKQ